MFFQGLQRILAASILLSASSGLAAAQPSKYLLNLETGETPAGHPYIQGFPCESVKEQVTAIRRWTQNLGYKLGPFPKAYDLGVEHGECRYILTQSVPSFALGFSKKLDAYGGVNCWNSALASRGVVPEFRFSSDSEVSFFLSSPLCHPLAEGTDPKPGDFEIYRGLVKGRLTEVHAAQYISDRLVYAKRGPFLSARLRVGSSLSEWEAYKSFFEKDTGSSLASLPSACFGTSNPKNCLFSMQYFRCQSMSAYLSRHVAGPDFLRLDPQVDALEAKLAKIVRGEIPVQSGTVAQLKTEISSLSMNVDLARKRMGLDPRDRFLLDTLKARVISFPGQLTWFKASRAANQSPEGK